MSIVLIDIYHSCSYNINLRQYAECQMKNPEFYIDHETRIRIQEDITKDIRSTLNRLDDRMDNQFKWIVGILITTVLLPISLHMFKLI